MEPIYVFIDLNRDKTGFKIDTAATQQQTCVNFMRIVITWPIVIGVPAIWILFVVLCGKSVFKYQSSNFWWYFTKKWAS